MARKIQPGPMATFPKWKELGRYVRKGEKAIVLCQPVTCKRAIEQEDGGEESATFTKFFYRPLWFVLAQTEGQDLVSMPILTWDREKALAALNITEVPFDATDGNVMGFARGRSIAVSPLNPMPTRRSFTRRDIFSSAIPARASRTTAS